MKIVELVLTLCFGDVLLKELLVARKLRWRLSFISPHFWNTAAWFSLYLHSCTCTIVNLIWFTINIRKSGGTAVQIWRYELFTSINLKWNEVTKYWIKSSAEWSDQMMTIASSILGNGLLMLHCTWCLQHIKL